MLSERMWPKLQTAYKYKPTEAEQRRAEFRVYESGAESDKQKALKKRRRLRFRQRAQVLASVFLIFMMSMGYMMLNTQITMLGYEINKTMAAIDSLSNDNAKLLLEIETATSPEKVNAYAMEHFNMVSATEDSVVYYEKSLQNDYQVANNGMAMDPAVLGYGSVEVLEQDSEKNILDAISSLWRSFTTDDRNVQVGMRN